MFLFAFIPELSADRAQEWGRLIPAAHGGRTVLWS